MKKIFEIQDTNINSKFENNEEESEGNQTFDSDENRWLKNVQGLPAVMSLKIIKL